MLTGGDLRRRGGVRAEEVDAHVAMSIRRRRIMLGLTQQQVADLVGVTYQQAHKYETGTNRISAARLHALALALGVGPGHFFEGLSGAAGRAEGPGEPGRLALAHDFAALPSARHRAAFLALARALAGGGGRGGNGAGQDLGPSGLPGDGNGDGTSPNG